MTDAPVPDNMETDDAPLHGQEQAAATLKAEGHIGFVDLWRAAVAEWYARRLVLVALVLGAPALVALAWAGPSALHPLVAALLFAPAALFVVAVLLAPLLLAGPSLIDWREGLRGRVAFTFTEEGYHVDGERGIQMDVDWSAIQRVTEEGPMFVLHHSKRLVTPVPKRAFANGKQDVQAFRTLVIERLGPVRARVRSSRRAS